jgi:hypothetical protein
MKGFINAPFVVVLALALMGIGQPIPQTKSGPQDHNEVSGQAPSPPIGSQGQPSPEVQEDGSTNETKSIWQKAFSPESWPAWALVLVGVGGILAALRTLRAIERQAGIMERQTAAAETAAEAANKNIEMFISKERARLRIDLKPLSLSPKYGSAYTVDFAVNIYGATEAYIVETRCAAYVLPWENVGSPEVASAVMFPIHSLPNVIPPNAPAYEQHAFLHLDHPEPIISEISLNRLFVGLRGFIKYRDVFDRERETRFRYVWRFNLNFGGATGNWEKCGAEEDNQET